MAQPITTPITLRYKPIAKHDTTITESMVISSGSQVMKTNKVVTIVSSAQESGSDLIWELSMTSVDFQIEKDGQTQRKTFGSSSVPYLSILMWMNARGEIDRFDIDPGSSVFNEDKSMSHSKALAKFTGLFKKLMPPYPSAPIRQGDTLYSVDFGSLIGSLVPRAKGLGSGTVTSRAEGIVTRQGRPHLLAVYQGAIEVGQFKLTMAGQELLDIDTGHRSYSLSTIEGNFVIGRDDVHLSGREERESKLPFSAASQSPAPKSVKRDDMERRLEVIKRLLDKGLITEEEATQKRNSILEAL
jgi:hypothetical protein